MSRFAKKTKTEEEMPVIEDATPPTESIEIDLGSPADGEVTIQLAEPKTEVEPKVETKVEVKTETETEENPLQKALEAQRRAEELQQRAIRERDEAIRRAQEREQELGRERVERADAEYNSVLTAIAAEQAAADKAEMDYAQAMAAADYAAAAKAQRVLAAATARLDRLEDGKRAFDSKREMTEEPAVTRTQQPAQPQNFEARLAQFPPDAREWLRKHPDFIEDSTKARKASGVHSYLVDTMGVEPFSRTYFDQLETHLGLKTAPQVTTATTTQEQPQKRNMPMSAPVSRAAPATSGQRTEGKMTLTAEEREVARNSFSATDMTNAQKEYLYAQNKAKLLRMRANGQYRQTTEQNG